MAEVVFDQTRVPRSLKRAEWREAYRRVRVMRRDVRIDNIAKIYVLHEDRISTEARQRLIDELVNPPLILGPYQ